MEIPVETRPFTTIETEALVTYVFEDNDPVQGRVAELDQACGGALRKLSSSGELTAKWLETTLVHFPAGLVPQRLLLIGAGKRDKFNVAQLRKLAGAALRYLKARKIARLAFLPWEADSNSASAQAITESLLVAQGSAEPPRVIVVTYTPPEVRPGAPVIGLVGKGVTFDTGGISIKPAEGMEKMKYDMAGGATMLGVMRALARLKPALQVIAVVPATENMPGGRAQKPGDVQVSLAGKTIEVLNTDAEARLILPEGLAYPKQAACTHLVDAATLTGAIVVALSNVNAGVFGSDAAFTERLLASARSAGAKMWQIPLDDEYREMIKSTIADIQNVSSGKGGGAITAAMFLKEFAGDAPWVHLDIAGTAWLDEAKPWAAKGGSGIAVRTLIDFVMNFPADGK